VIPHGQFWNPVTLTALCWLTADAYWILLAPRAKRTVARGQKSATRAVYLASLLLGFALYYLPLSSVPILGWRVLPKTDFIAALGLLLCTAGVGFAIWARHVLGNNWSGAVTLKADHLLVQNGPFGLVRHPIYLGLLAAMAGTGIVIGEVRAFLPLFNIIGIYKKIAAEETLLRQAFPDAYPAYESRVKKLLPWTKH
jgi:protein-S-isoprenylcysteine O-methyltransferase Ste14